LCTRTNRAIVSARDRFNASRSRSVTTDDRVIAVDVRSGDRVVAAVLR
jgi:hypothetical protein